MKQIASVVFAFIALNAAGFVVYRASSTSDAATVESVPSNTAPDTAASQPKPSGSIAPTVTEKQTVSAPTPTASVEDATVPAPTSNLVDNSRAPIHTRVVKTPPRRVQQNAAATPTSKPVVEAPAPQPPAPAAAPTDATPSHEDVIHKMEANPYKRGE
jgi:hypothetical protein